MGFTSVPRRNLKDNHAAVAAFSRSLSEAFADWARQPVSATLPSLTVRLQTLAEGQFEAAYLRGKRQAFPKSDLSANDLRFVREQLQKNASYLKTSLEPDIRDKMRRQQLSGNPDTAEVITQAFGARVEQLFGGSLWKVQEAGFAAGVRAIGHMIRTRPRPIAQETLLQRINRLKGQKEDSDLLATPKTLARDESTVTAWNQAMEREIAARQANVEESSAKVADEAEIAAAFDLPIAELTDAISDPGFRVGTRYIAENDSATCDPCHDNSEGGENGDGIYWEPDDPPIPGEDCDGFSNCRCVLETVYGTT